MPMAVPIYGAKYVEKLLCRLIAVQSENEYYRSWLMVVPPIFRSKPFRRHLPWPEGRIIQHLT